MVEIYERVLLEVWNEQNQGQSNERSKIVKEIKEYESKLSHIRDLLTSQKLDADEFRIMKSEMSQKIENLEVQLTNVTSESKEIKGLISKGVTNLLKLSHSFENQEFEKKIQLISSIFPEKLIIVNNTVLTVKINEIVNTIYMIDKNLEQKNKRPNSEKTVWSNQVGTTRFELATSCTPCKHATGLRYVPNLFLFQGCKYRKPTAFSKSNI